MPECVRVTQQELLWQEDRERGGQPTEQRAATSALALRKRMKEAPKTERAGEEGEVVYEPEQSTYAYTSTR